MSNYEAKFNDLLGKVITSFVGSVGDDEIHITTEDGSKYRMFHYQSCCESAPGRVPTRDRTE